MLKDHRKQSVKTENLVSLENLCSKGVKGLKEVSIKDLKVGAFITTQFYFYRWLHMKKNTGAGVGKIAGTVSPYDVVSESEFVSCLCVI